MHDLTTATLFPWLVAEADVVLLPSIELGTWVENQACIVQEAMLMKAAVVATAAGGVPESLAPELRPYLVPPEDPGAIARAVLALRGVDDAGMRALGEAGRAVAEARYDVRRLNAALLRAAGGVRAGVGRRSRRRRWPERRRSGADVGRARPGTGARPSSHCTAAD